MSKPIYLTKEDKEQYLKEFYEMLNTGKLPSGEINFKRSIPESKEKAKLLFTPIAWDKMNALIKEFNLEIGWHGLVKRGDEEKNEFIVYDILVYPQTVTSATITTDQKKYTAWLYTQSDENFKDMKFHGHSHVRMGTTPSHTDIDHQTGILDQLEDDMFYVFTIWNKQMEHFVKIYDMKKNILFEKNDVTISLTDCDYDRDAFILEAKSMAATVTPAYNGYQGGSYGGSGYQGGSAYQNGYNNGGYSGSYQNQNANNKPAVAQTKPQEMKDEKPSFNGVKSSVEDKKKSDGGKSDKNNNKKKGTVVSIDSYKAENYDIYDDDDYYRYT